MLATALSTITGTLAARPPFDFGKTLDYLRGFSPTGGEQTLAVGSLTKAVTVSGQAVAFEVQSAGTVEHPQLAYTLFTEHPLSDADHAAVVDRMRYFLGLDDDLSAFYAIGLADPLFAPVIRRFYGLHHPKFLTPFEIACWAVLSQRIPMPRAHRMKLALVERWGTSITLSDGTYRAFPEPEQMAAVDERELAMVICNARKVEYLLAVIAFFNAVDEQFLRAGPYDEVAARIRGIRGVGEWSSHFILVRGLGRMERVSAIDKELANAAAKLYNQGQPLAAAEMQQVLERYGATQGYWAYYARIAVMERFEMMGM